VDDRPIVWDAANRRHLGADHPERHISLLEMKRRFKTRIGLRLSLRIGGESNHWPDVGGPVAGGDLDRRS
jgi:hypothetical protein